MMVKNVSSSLSSWGHSWNIIEDCELFKLMNTLCDGDIRNSYCLLIIYKNAQFLTVKLIIQPLTLNIDLSTAYVEILWK